eukprot:COSAG06_NODE_30270_length_541_cov_2.556250_1_plen_112_part_10
MSAAFAVVGLCFLLQPLECSRIPNDNPYSVILGSLPVEGPGPTGQRLKLDNDAMPPRTLLWDGKALLRGRAAVASRSAHVAAAAVRLGEDAAKALLVKPLSVTSKASPPAGG